MNRLLKDGARLALEPAADGRAARVWVLSANREVARRASPPNSGCGSRPRTTARAGRRRRDQGAARRHVLAVDRRQHGRGLDALGARAVRVQPDDAAQRRGAGRQAARQVRRHHPPRPEPARDRRTAPAARTSGPSIAAASATTGSPRSRSSSPSGGTLVTLGAASDLAIERLGVPLKNLKSGPDPRSALRAGHDPAGSRSTPPTRSATA